MVHLLHWLLLLVCWLLLLVCWLLLLVSWARGLSAEVSSSYAAVQGISQLVGNHCTCTRNLLFSLTGSRLNDHEPLDCLQLCWHLLCSSNLNLTPAQLPVSCVGLL